MISNQKITLNTFPLRSESAASIILSNMAHGGQAPKDVITFASSYYEKEIQKLYLFFNKFDVKDVAIVF